MGDGIISRRGGGGYATINFNLPDSPPTKSAARDLSQARYGLAGTTNGNYALFAGGMDSSHYYDVVDIYDTDLNRFTLENLGQARAFLAATTVGNYAIFAGGFYKDSNEHSYSSSYVDAYNNTYFTKSNPSYLSNSRRSAAAATIGNYALFAGGWSESYSVEYGYLDTIEVYDNNLGKVTSPANLSEEKSGPAATTVGNYVLFGGGSDYYIKTVDAYNASLAKTTVATLNKGRGQLAATTVGDYALFGGGYNLYADVNKYYDTVDVYYKTLTKTTPLVLSQARSELAATTVGDYAIFAGGSYYSPSPNYLDVVDIFHSTLVRTDSEPLSAAKNNLAATTLGNHALFAGGKFDYPSSGNASVGVAAYSVAEHEVQLFPETKYSFNGAAESTSSTWQTINVTGKLIGYMKIKSAQIN